MATALRRVETVLVGDDKKKLKFIGLATIYGVPLACFQDSKGGKMFWSPEYSGARLQALNSAGLESSETAKGCLALADVLGKPLAAIVINGREMQKISLPGCHRPEKNVKK